MYVYGHIIKYMYVYIYFIYHTHMHILNLCYVYIHYQLKTLTFSFFYLLHIWSRGQREPHVSRSSQSSAWHLISFISHNTKT